MTEVGRFEIWNSTLTAKLVDVPEIRGVGTVQDVASDTGSISDLQLGMDEAAAAHVVETNHLRCYIGDEIVITARIETPIKRQHIHIDGPAKELITLPLCRGRASLLDDAPIDPYGGNGAKPASTQRPMIWASPEQDVSGWSAASVIYSRVSVPWSGAPDPPYFDPWLRPVGWINSAASLIWCRALSGGGHPVGDGLFVGDYTVPSGEGGLYRIEVLADDYFELYGPNGMFIEKGVKAPDDNFVACTWAFIELSPGPTRWGIRGSNYDRRSITPIGTFGAPNKGYVAMSLHYMPDGVGTAPTAGLLRFQTSSSWKSWDLLASPTVPAPTWGKILLQLLTEGQAAGTIPTTVTPTFTATLTSAGTPWEPHEGVVLDLDNDTVLSVARTGHESGCIDWRFSPDGLSFEAYNYGEMGQVLTTNFVGALLLDAVETLV